MNRQPTKWFTVFANPMTNKGLTSTMWEELTPLSTKQKLKTDLSCFCSRLFVLSKDDHWWGACSLHCEFVLKSIQGWNNFDNLSFPLD